MGDTFHADCPNYDVFVVECNRLMKEIYHEYARNRHQWLFASRKWLDSKDLQRETL
jgi:hypothetical protein